MNGESFLLEDNEPFEAVDRSLLQRLLNIASRWLRRSDVKWSMMKSVYRRVRKDEQLDEVSLYREALRIVGKESYLSITLEAEGEGVKCKTTGRRARETGK